MKLLFRRSEEDLGAGPNLIAWRPMGSAIAVAGSNNSIFLYDRKGDVIDALDLSTKVSSIAWDREGDVLSIIADSSSSLILWDFNTKVADMIDISMGSREVPSVMTWSEFSPILIVGTLNGNLFIYNHRTARKVPIVGKHQRKITGVAISREEEIVCCSDDNTLTISNIEGETRHSLPLNNEPTNLALGEVKKSNGNVDIIISCVLGKKILLFTPIDTPENSTNLQFQDRYGNIVSYVWYGDGLMMLGFDKGFIVAISAHQSEIGQEIFCFPEYKNYLAGVAANSHFDKLLSIGDHQLKIRDMNSNQEMFLMADIDTEKELSCVSCSTDGQLVAVSSLSGTVAVYLTKMPVLGAAYLDTTAVLSSLTQVTVVPDGDKKRQCLVDCVVEPSLLSVGPMHVGVATNNRVWYYDYVTSGNPEADLVCEKEYLSSVLQVQLNSEYAAVVMSGKVRLHKIIERDDDQSMTFPENSRNARLLSAALTEHFLIFTTDTQYIVYFSISEWAIVGEYRHTSPPKRICPDPDGLRCTVFDERLDTWVYSPLDDSMLKLPPVGATVHYKSALWESFTIDRDSFIVYDNTNIYSFLVSRSQVDGESIEFVGSTKLPYGHDPLMLNKGIVHCLTSSGKTSGVLLESHRTDTLLDGKSEQQIREILNRTLVLKRWTYAWRICEKTNSLSDWNLFAETALNCSDIELALRIFRHIGDVSMVFALQELLPIEEKNLLGGQIAVLLGKFDQAETLLLQCSKPIEALNMRRDLLEWPRALVLAEKLAPQEITSIAKEYAQQLEFMGEYANALAHYEMAEIKEDDGSEQVQEHNEICRSGIARMSIRTGDIRRGTELARQLEGRIVKRDCAIALEQLKQLSEAAELYEIGLYFDRAAAVCMKAKAWGKVGELLPKVRSPKIHAQFGRVMEAEKKYKQAAIAYKNARDYDNLVRMLLDHLDMAEEAVKVVRESRSVEGAKLVARFFSKLGDHSSAIQFLILSHCEQEAFQLAETHERMTDYADAIEENGTPEQFLQLAEYFAGGGDHTNAGRFLLRAGQYAAALEHLMNAGESHDALTLAIEAVAASDDKQLAARLTEYLMGEVDGVPKEAQYLFRMFVALKQTREAARTAIVIAREEQEKGQYKIARNVLFAMYQELISKKIRIPQEMEHSLMLIHSYMLVRLLVKRNENVRAARLLLRVVANISRFPEHIVSILTSAVVICSKAGLKSSALQCAIQLMQPEYRNKIDAKYKKKIESLVRKSEKSPDPEEAKSPCVFCQNMVAETELSCNKCKNTLPYCIITGRHIISSDFAVCPSCNFPGYYSEFKKLLTAGDGCPMCGSPLKEVIPGDAREYLTREETD